MKKSLALSLLLLSQTSLLRAVDDSWNVTTGGSWATGSNWTSGTAGGASGAGSIATFGTDIPTGLTTITLDGDRTVGSLIFTDPTTPFGTWVIASGSGGALTLNPNAGTSSITVNASTTANIQAIIHGTAGFTADGLGTLILSGANDYTGITTIKNGKVRVDHASALGATGAGNNTIITATDSPNNATLSLNGVTIAEDLTFSDNNSAGRTSLTNESSATSKVTGNITLSGAGGGLLQLAPDSAAGTLEISGNIGFAPGSAMSVYFRGSGTGLFSGIATLNTSFVKTDGGTWTIASTGSTWITTTQISDGTLKLGVNNALPDLKLTVGQASGTIGKFDLNGFNQTLPSLDVDNNSTTATSQIITNSSSTTLSTLTITYADTSTTQTFEGIISGNLAIIKQGLGNQILSGANTYTGSTEIQNGGKLTIASNGALGSSAVGAETTLSNVSGPTGGTGTVLALQGNINSAEIINLAGGASDRRVSIVNVSGDNTLSGAIKLSGGSGTQVYSEGGTLNLSGAISGIQNFVLRGESLGNNQVTGTINLGSNAVAKTGGGAWTLASSTGNIYNQLSIQAGTIKLGINNAMPVAAALVFGQGDTSAGKFDMNGFSQTVGRLDIDNSSTAKQNQDVTNASSTASTLTVNTSAANLYEGKITGNINLTKSGTGTLTLGDAEIVGSGANTYTGVTSVTLGTLALAGTAQVNQSSEISIATGATFDVSTRTGGGYSFGNNVTGTGTLKTSSVGVFELLGTNAQLRPGGNSGASIGTLNVLGNISVATGSSILLQITSADTNIGSALPSTITDPTLTGTHDFVNIDGLLSFTGGKIIVENLGYTTAILGDVFDLVDWTGAGTLAGFNASTDLLLPTLNAGLGWETSRFASLGVISVVAIPEPSRALLLFSGLLLAFFRRKR